MVISFFGGMPGGGEMLLIFVVLLLLFGSKRLPEIARTLGKTLDQFRRAARDVTDEIMQDEPPKPPEAKKLPEVNEAEKAPDERAG